MDVIPTGERSKARVCGRLLAGPAGSTPAGAWMFVLCCTVRTKGKAGTVRTKKYIYKYRKQKNRLIAGVSSKGLGSFPGQSM